MKIDAELVKHLRVKNNWSQEQMGEASGLSLRTIQRLEASGKASRESVKLLAVALGVDPNTLSVPEQTQSMTPTEAIRRGFVEFSNVGGSATRFEYWWFFLFVLLVLAAAEVINGQLLQIVALIVLVPLLAAGNRRLNDSGHSGWWQLFWFVPFGQVVVLIMLAMESKSAAEQAQEKGVEIA